MPAAGESGATARGGGGLCLFLAGIASSCFLQAADVGSIAPANDCLLPFAVVKAVEALTMDVTLSAEMHDRTGEISESSLMSIIRIHCDRYAPR